jgi:hypothetical protein
MPWKRRFCSYCEDFLGQIFSCIGIPHHLPAYLNEFTFRFNRRYWRGPAFHRALGLIAHAQKWPEYDALYSVAKGGVGAWAHPSSTAATHRKASTEGDKAMPLHVVVT